MRKVYTEYSMPQARFLVFHKVIDARWEKWCNISILSDDINRLPTISVAESIYFQTPFFPGTGARGVIGSILELSSEGRRFKSDRVHQVQSQCPGPTNPVANCGGFWFLCPYPHLVLVFGFRSVILGTYSHRWGAKIDSTQIQNSAHESVIQSVVPHRSV